MCFGTRGDDRISRWSLTRIGLLVCGVLIVLANDPVSGVAAYGRHGETAKDLFLAITLGAGLVGAARWFLAFPALRRLHNQHG